jgi:hypothetical protein
MLGHRADWEVRVSDWYRVRVEAAAGALARAPSGTAVSELAHAAVQAADRAAGGVVPREDYEQLALDLGAWRLRALQTEALLERALALLDEVAAPGEGAPARLRNASFATSVEIRAALDARRDPRDDDPAT